LEAECCYCVQEPQAIKNTINYIMACLHFTGKQRKKLEGLSMEQTLQQNLMGCSLKKIEVHVYRI